MRENQADQLFCKNIGYMRRVKGLTQKEIAQILGIGVATVRKIERCDPRVRLTGMMVYRVCAAFRISSDAILRIDLEKNST